MCRTIPAPAFSSRKRKQQRLPVGHTCIRLIILLLVTKGAPRIVSSTAVYDAYVLACSSWLFKLSGHLPFLYDRGTSTRSLSVPEILRDLAYQSFRYSSFPPSRTSSTTRSHLHPGLSNAAIARSTALRRGSSDIFRTQRLVNSEVSRSTRVHRTCCWKALRSRKDNCLKYANFTFSSEFDAANTV